MAKILKNNTNNAIDIPDTGQQVPALGTLTIATQDYDLYASSDDLVTFIGNGSLILNNGTEDLSKSESIRVIQGGFSNKILLDDSLLDTQRIKVDVTGTLNSPELVDIKDGDGDTKVTTEKNPDEDKIRFETAGVERVIIDEVGRVGVGGDPDVDAILNVKDQSGKIVTVEQASNQPVKFGIKKANGNLDQKTPPLNGEALCTYSFCVWDGTNYRETSSIETRAKQDISSTALGAEISFKTTSVFTQTSVTRLLIQENGDTNLFNNKLVSVKDPTNPQDAATKAYVDSQAQANELGWAQFSSTNSQSLSANSRTKLLWNSGFSVLDLEAPASAASWFSDVDSLFFPDSSGDFYTARLTVTVTPNQGDREFTLDLDIGGTQGIIWSNTTALPKSGGSARTYSFAIPLFTLGTFVANGGKFSITMTTTGSVSNPQLLLQKTYKA